MAEGAWVLLGSVIGLFGSILTTWLNARYALASKYPGFDTAANRLLKRRLQKDTWVEIKQLVSITGMTESDVKEYLICIGARGSSKNGRLWTIAADTTFKNDPESVGE